MAFGKAAAGDFGALATAARAQFRRTADRKQLALANHCHQVAQLLGLGHVVSRQKDGRALLRGQRGEVVAEARGRNRIEAGRGLVQKNQSRAMQQRPRNGQFLLHAAAPLHHRFLAPIP